MPGRVGPPTLCSFPFPFPSIASEVQSKKTVSGYPKSEIQVFLIPLPLSGEGEQKVVYPDGIREEAKRAGSLANTLQPPYSVNF